MAYDTKCYDLAKAFLSDEPALNSEDKRKSLAQHIQTEIENWIGWEGWNEQRITAEFKSTAD